MKILFVTLIGLVDYTYQSGWSYDYQTQWPGLCRGGQLQSPINIMTRDAIFDKHEAHIRGPLVMRGYGDVKVTAINNGHTLRWKVKPDTEAPVLSGGPLRGNYTFLQFHLHWLSEHAIDGMKYPMEIHMVHVKTGVPVDEALKRPDGLAVIGVMCQIYSNEESQFALEQIMPAVPDLASRSEEETDPKNIDLRRLLSPNPQSYYTYHGSLTTPDCQESVTWIVMDKPLIIADTQYQVFSKVDVGGRDNYRNLQQVNRVVYRSVASCSTILMPSFFGTIISLISCLSSSLTAGVNKGYCYIVNIKRRLLGSTVKKCAKLA